MTREALTTKNGYQLLDVSINATPLEVLELSCNYELRDAIWGEDYEIAQFGYEIKVLAPIEVQALIAGRVEKFTVFGYVEDVAQNRGFRCWDLNNEAYWLIDKHRRTFALTYVYWLSDFKKKAIAAEEARRSNSTK